MGDHRGFTLIELMIVISIIGVLSSIAVPNILSYRTKAYQSEALVLSDAVRKDIVDYYEYRGILPETNSDAGLPKPEAIKGKYVESITVTNGIISIRMGGEETGLVGLTIVLRPQIPEDRTGPVIWIREDKTLEEA